MKQYRNIGKLVTAFGLRGELVLHHHLGKKTSLKGLEVLFLELRKNEMFPYFVENAAIRNEEEVYIKLEGINTKENARRLVRKEAWLTEEDFHKYAAKSNPGSWVGYHLINENNDLGEILEVIEQPHQILCRIELQGKEAYIPIHEETLKKTDKKNKKLFVTLPEGLLDVYLK